MSYLIIISIGPVQDFIAAARRTADLQVGSELLVEIACEVSKSLDANGAELIFPAKNKDGLFTDGPNKIVAIVKEGNPAEIAASAKGAAQKYLVQEWTKVEQRLDSIRDMDRALAVEQIRQFLEFYAAWVPIEGENGYAEARRQADFLLAGRKALRDFPQPVSKSQNQKSPLDPSRDSIFRTGDGWKVPPVCQERPLWLKPSETLDAVSVLKRVRGVEARNTVPSTSLMAARSILTEADKIAPDEYKTLKDLQEYFGGAADIGDMLFPNRLKDVLTEQKEELKELEREASKARKGLLTQLNRSSCPAYYAVLVADGDKMGALLNELTTPKEHQQVSKALMDFSVRAKKIVNAKFEGHAIYTGGDDVLAFVPINRSVECAESLAEAFIKELESSVTLAKSRTDKPVGGTLSVGVALVHFMEPLQTALKFARDAEKQAKKDRNSLAVWLHTRGSEGFGCAESWDKLPAQQWKLLVAIMGGKLSRGLPYELRRLAQECSETKLTPERVNGEAKRILLRKVDKEGSEAEYVQVRNELEAIIMALNGPNDLRKFADKLVIARFMAGIEIGGGSD